MTSFRPLGELCTVITKGTTPNAKLGGFSETGVNYVKSESLSYSGGVDESKFVHISEATHQKLKRSILRERDILMSIAGANLGKVGMVKKSILPANTNQAVAIIRVNPDEANPEFVQYFLRDSRFVANSLAGVAQSAQPNLNLGDISRFEIPEIPIGEQEKIAALLGALDDKIELNRRMSATLEEIARALYRSWFVDFDPVHARALGQPPAHMDANTAALFPDSFGPDGLPKGWETCPLSEVCTQVKKTVKPMAAPEAEFLHFSLPAFDAGRMPVREAGAAIKSNKAHVPHDAILFSRLNPSIPRVWWAKTKAMDGTPAASTEFFVAAAHDPVETSWLYCLLSSSDFRDEALSRVTGTSNSHQRVPPKALAEIEVIAPQPEVVEAFGELSGPWFEKVHSMAQENQTLAALRDALLPRLMSGELRIREAEKQVEEVV